MPCFNIVKKSEIKQTFRVSHIMGDFDVNLEHANEHFQGEIKMPEKWNIGLIVGGSGTGKTTIARELFGANIITGFEYKAASVVDDMPKDCSMTEIGSTPLPKFLLIFLPWLSRTMPLIKISLNGTSPVNSRPLNIILATQKKIMS